MELGQLDNSCNLSKSSNPRPMSYFGYTFLSSILSRFCLSCTALIWLDLFCSHAQVFAATHVHVFPCRGVGRNARACVPLQRCRQQHMHVFPCTCVGSNTRACVQYFFHLPYLYLSNINNHHKKIIKHLRPRWKSFTKFFPVFISTILFILGYDYYWSLL